VEPLPPIPRPEMVDAGNCYGTLLLGTIWTLSDRVYYGAFLFGRRVLFRVFAGGLQEARWRGVVCEDSQLDAIWPIIAIFWRKRVGGGRRHLGSRCAALPGCSAFFVMWCYLFRSVKLHVSRRLCDGLENFGLHARDSSRDAGSPARWIGIYKRGY